MFTIIIVQTHSLSRELQNVNCSDTIAIYAVYTHVYYAYISITAPYTYVHHIHMVDTGVRMFVGYNAHQHRHSTAF